MPTKGSEIVDIQVVLKRSTENAWCVQSTDTDKAAWVPKSLGELEKTSDKYHTLTLPTWLAEEKELV